MHSWRINWSQEKCWRRARRQIESRRISKRKTKGRGRIERKEEESPKSWKRVSIEKEEEKMIAIISLKIIVKYLNTNNMNNKLPLIYKNLWSSLQLVQLFFFWRLHNRLQIVGWEKLLILTIFASNLSLSKVAKYTKIRQVVLSVKLVI